LLAQADSCIGAKTSLNYKNYKNLIGTFYPPIEIYLYTGFIKTLKTIDYFSGLGEIGKLHLNGGENNIKKFIDNIQEILKGNESILLEAIKNSLKIKKSYIEDDEFDTGKRNMLNFGHCFGHAIESATDFDIPHGQAVVIGIILANIIARKRSLLSKENELLFYDKILAPIIHIDIKKYNLNSQTFITKIIDAMKQDKKRIGSGLPLIIINDKSKMVKLTDIKEEEVESALKEI
jgi:3-dehydroquinate synthase